MSGSALLGQLVSDGEEEFRGRDQLAGVALGVVGDVNEEPTDGRGESPATDGARAFEIGCGQIANAHGGVVEALMKLVKDCSNGSVWFGFGFEHGELGIVELLAFGVSKESVDAAGDMADVESDGWQAVGLGMKVFLAETEAPVVDTFESEFEGVEDGEMDGGKVFGVAAEPGFGVFSEHE